MSDKSNNSDKGITENLKLLREINSSLLELKKDIILFKNDIFMLNNEVKCIKSIMTENNKQVKKNDNISTGWFFG